MFQQLIISIKELLDVSPEKRSTIFALLFTGIIIWYLYSENQNLSEKIKLKESQEQENKLKVQNDCEEQLKTNREIQQKQLNAFYIEMNEYNDSLNRYYRNQLTKANLRIKTELNKLKDENNN